MSSKIDQRVVGASGGPFLRWAGGKRWLASVIAPILETMAADSVYCEPFLGGGSMFFEGKFGDPILSDLNEELIVCYREVRDNPDGLVERLASMKNGRNAYLEVRRWVPESPVDVAARLIYLNACSFNGLYRVNKRGVFNVPFGGRHLDVEVKRRKIASASVSLSNARLMAGDFEMVIGVRKAGDVIYCDPTYCAVKAEGEFTRYNNQVFSWSDQIRLRNVLGRVVERGVTAIVSNSFHPDVQRIYHPYRAIEVWRNSLIGRSSSRRRVSEALYVMSKDAALRRLISLRFGR